MELNDLKKMLEQNKIDVSLYGKGEAKSLENLLQEINEPKEGVKLVYADKLLRIVNVLNIHVMYQDGSNLLRLYEKEQVFNDGRVRIRNDRQAAIAEKWHVGRNADADIFRAFKEELGIDINLSRVTKLGLNVTRTSSQSYPGLTSEYWVRYFLYLMEEEYFRPEGYVEVQKDKRTYFAWAKV